MTVAEFDSVWVCFIAVGFTLYVLCSEINEQTNI